MLGDTQRTILAGGLLEKVVDTPNVKGYKVHNWVFNPQAREFLNPSLGIPHLEENPLATALDKNFAEQGVAWMDKLVQGDAMADDVRQLFSFLNRAAGNDQQIKALDNERRDFLDKANALKKKVLQAGMPIVAKKPNGDHYVIYLDDTGEPTIDDVKVVNL